jgi:hypothetical protein
MLIRIRQGKGRRDRDVPLSPILLEDLTRILAMDEAENVFVSRHSQRLVSRQSRNFRFHSYLERGTGLEPV